MRPYTQDFRQMENGKSKVGTAGVAGGAVSHLHLNEAGRGERGKGKGNNKLNRANHSKHVKHFKVK